MSAFDFFDEIWCIHNARHPERWPKMQARFAALGIAERVERLPAIPSAADERIGRALSHRRVVQGAAERAARSVLVVEDETLFIDRADAVLEASLPELRGRDWRLLHLASARGGAGLAVVSGCTRWRQAEDRSEPYALAYSAAVFEDFLKKAPLNFGAMEDFLGDDDSLCGLLAALGPAFAIHPAIATVPSRLPFQEPVDQRRFIP